MSRLGKDYHIAATDLLVSIVCGICVNNAKSGKLSTFALNDVDYPSYAYILIALASFLGFLHWGFFPFNSQLQRFYSFAVAASKTISIPYLLFMLVEQNIVPSSFVFAGLVGAFIALYTALSSYKRAQYEQQLTMALTVIPLVLVAGQGVLSQDPLRIGIGLCFAAIAAVGKNYALLHYILAVALYLIESSRSGGFFKLY